MTEPRAVLPVGVRTSFSPMIPIALRPLVVALFGLAAVAAPGAELPILAKARAYLGGDAAIDAVKSVHYVGTLLITEEDGKLISRAKAELFFQKPEQQRVEATYEKTAERVAYRETTALDGYEAWQILEDLADPTRWQFKVFDTPEVRGLRATTWENLNFYRGIEAHGGRIEDLGEVTTEGVKCRKVGFIYGPALAFYRHFEVDTGRLVFTETGNGTTLKEEGELRVNGLRYPQRIIQRSRDADGRIKVLTTTFDTITLNETFPTAFFALPQVPRPGAKPAMVER